MELYTLQMPTFNPPNNPFYRWGNGGTTKLSNLLKIRDWQMVGLGLNSGSFTPKSRLSRLCPSLLVYSVRASALCQWLPVPHNLDKPSCISASLTIILHLPGICLRWTCNQFWPKSVRIYFLGKEEHLRMLGKSNTLELFKLFYVGFWLLIVGTILDDIDAK